MKNSHFVGLLSVVLLLIGLRSAYFYLKDNEQVKKFLEPSPDIAAKDPVSATETKPASTPKIAVPISDLPIAVPKKEVKKKSVKDLGPCDDPLWCNVPMPKTSYFRFPPPTDEYRWRKAQIQAMTGEQVLLKKSVAVFPNYLDYIDGDSSFRKYNYPIDVFIDKKRDLAFLKKPLNPPSVKPKPSPSRKLKSLNEFEWEKLGIEVIPPNYDYLDLNRAPVIKLGYFAFSKEGGANWFDGPQVGEAALGLRSFLDKWKAVKDEIATPFIAIHNANENWGLLSTYFPNRTIDWGKCCDEYMPDLLDFLNHEKTLMFMVGQHANFTHPKLVTFPRGISLPITHTNRMMWDAQRWLLEFQTQTKNQLVFTAASNWGPRPQITKCVAAKFSEKDFQGASYGDNQKGRYGQKEYYRRLGMSRTGLALSGLGADCFRLWEAMYLGTVPVLEKGFGLDKLLWRLPALLVEDFDLVTPELLRVAYIEALYHSEEFQYEKLTQSFWWSFIGNVSVTKSTQTVWDRFPPHADDTEFVRPFEPFTCWETNSCGPGTKRIPKKSC